jgi:hypothetical protein
MLEGAQLARRGQVIRRPPFAVISAIAKMFFDRESGVPRTSQEV